MTKYMYDGVLTSTEAGWARGLLQNYPHAVEVKNEIKTQVHDWIMANVQPVQGTGEDCMGQTYAKTYQPWAMFGKDDSTLFFLLKKEYADGLKKKFGDLVKTNIFKTEF